MTNTDTLMYVAKNGTLVHFMAYKSEVELLNEEGAYYTGYSEGGSAHVCVKDGVLQQGKTLKFETYAEAMAYFTNELGGFVEVSEAVAENMIWTAEVPPLPPMPEGMVPGTFAHTAWTMAQSGTVTGDEADAWKDEMKEGGQW